MTDTQITVRKIVLITVQTNILIINTAIAAPKEALRSVAILRLSQNLIALIVAIAILKSQLPRSLAIKNSAIKNLVTRSSAIKNSVIKNLATRSSVAILKIVTLAIGIVISAIAILKIVTLAIGIVISAIGIVILVIGIAILAIAHRFPILNGDRSHQFRVTSIQMAN